MEQIQAERSIQEKKGTEHTVRNIYPGKEWNRYSQKDLSRKSREQSTLSERSIQEKGTEHTVRKIYAGKKGNRAHCQKDQSRK
jgi:hypothetical protein